MNSSLIFLSNFTLKKDSYPNSVCFMHHDNRPCVFSLQTSGIDDCFFSFRIFNSYFYTPATPISEICKMYSSTQYGSASLNELLASVNIAIELNEFSNPEAVRLYSKSSSHQLLLMLELKWTSPDEQVKLQYSTNLIIKCLKDELNVCMSKLTSADSIKMNNLNTEFNILKEKVKKQEDKLSILETIPKNCEYQHSINTRKLEELTTAHNEGLSIVHTLSELNNKSMNEFKSQAKDMLNTLSIQSNVLQETKKSLAVSLSTIESFQNLIPTYSEIENLSQQCSLMLDHWGAKSSQYDTQVSWLTKEYASLKQAANIAGTEMKHKLKQLKELSELIPPFLGEDFQSDYIMQTHQHSKVMRSCVILSESEYAVGCTDGSIDCRHKTTHEITRTLKKEHTSWIMTMIVVGDLLITGSYDNSIKTWDWTDANKQSLITLTGHTGFIRSLVHVKEKIIASGSDDNSIKLWDIINSNCLITLKGHTNHIWGLLMFDNQTMLSVSGDSTIRLWNLTEISTAAELSNRKITDNIGTNGLCSVLQLSKSTVIVGTCKGKLNIWDVTVLNGQLIHSFTGQTSSIWQIVRLSFNLIASCSEDYSIYVWDIQSKVQVKILQGHISYVHGILRLSNSQFASISYDKTLRIWGTEQLN